MWIFRSWRLDIAWLIVPGLIGLILSQFIQKGSPALYPYYFFTYAIVDGGHIWLTHLRTYGSRAERTSTTRYYWVPLLVFGLFSTWYFLGIPYIWSFIFYNTVFHHVRQYYGVNRWYQKLSGRPDTYSNYFLYALLYLPFLLFHFRDDVNVKYFSSQDLLNYPSAELFQIFLPIYFAVFIAWMIYELYLYTRGVREWGRLLSILMPTALSGFCFLGGKNGIEIIFPMTLAHGIAYMGLIGLSLQRTQKERYQTWKSVAAVIAGTCILLGGYHFWMEEHWVDFDWPYTHLAPTIFMALLVGAHATAVITHYIFDAYIWSGKHREAALVFSRNDAN